MLKSRISLDWMRTIREILSEIRSRPLRYWLGWDEPLMYEVDNGRVVMLSGGSRREILVLGEIKSWRRDGSTKSVCVYLPSCTEVIGDPCDKLGSILEREVPERWVVDAENE